MKKILLSFFISLIFCNAFAQNVGIGTNTPNNKALLDLQSNSKGVLFPRLTTVQRLAITNPPNGLHVFNTDLNSLECYDSLNNDWVPYSNKVYDTTISTSVSLSQPYCIIRYNPVYKVYKITVDSGVKTSIAIMTAPYITLKPVKVFVFNYGKIIGAGGEGGAGKYMYMSTNPDSCTGTTYNGEPGDAAIMAGANVTLTVFNYGIVAGGGGGGGGGSGGSIEGTGGGGGGGGQSGAYNSQYGIRARLYLIVNNNCLPSSYSSAQDGTGGTYSVAGIGGNGSPGTIFHGFKGGNGGSWGQPGENGLGASGGIGGAAGKAIRNFGGGPYSYTIINYGSGIIYGVID